MQPPGRPAAARPGRVAAVSARLFAVARGRLPPSAATPSSSPSTSGASTSADASAHQHHHPRPSSPHPPPTRGSASVRRDVSTHAGMRSSNAAAAAASAAEAPAGDARQVPAAPDAAALVARLERSLSLKDAAAGPSTSAPVDPTPTATKPRRGRRSSPAEGAGPSQPRSARRAPAALAATSPHAATLSLLPDAGPASAPRRGPPRAATKGATPAKRDGGEPRAEGAPARPAGPGTPDGALSTRPTRRAARLRTPQPARSTPPAAVAVADDEPPPAPVTRPGRGRPRRSASASDKAGLPPPPPAAAPLLTKPAPSSKKHRARFDLDDGEAAAVAGVLGPLAQRSAALSTPIPTDLADTPEAEDLRVMIALDDRMRSGRNVVKARAALSSVVPGAPEPATGPAATKMAATPAKAGRKAAAAADKADKAGGAGGLGAASKSTLGPSSAADNFMGVSPPSAAAHPVSALFVMLGYTGLLTREAEARLSQVVRKGRAAAAAGDALAARLGRAPTVGEVVASLGLRSPAHLRLLLANRQVAQDLMVQFNLRLVVHTAKRYAGMGLELADLIAEGVAGLTRAIDRYDAGRGFKFSTYAMWWVRQAITRALSEQSRVVRLPVHVYDAVSKLRRAGKALGSTVFESQDALHAALAEAVGLPVDKVERYLAAARTTRSLDAPTSGSGGAAGLVVGGGGGGAASGGGSAGSGSGSATDTTADPMNESLMSSAPTDVLDGGAAGPGGSPGDEPLGHGGGRGNENSDGAAARAAALRTHGVLRQRLDAVLASLPPRERNVLRLRYGLAAPGGRTMTLLDISTAYGVTTERIRQIEDSGLRRLRDPLRAAGVKDAAELVNAADAGGVAAADEVAALIAPPGVEAGPEIY